VKNQCIDYAKATLMTDLMGEFGGRIVRLDLDHPIKLDFHGFKVMPDAGLLACRELDDALELTELVSDQLIDQRAGRRRAS
jgi:hypothetical protein